MSDDPEALAREQEREADDLAKRSEHLGEHIEDAKETLEHVQRGETTPTPDPAIEGGEAPDPEANQPPPETRYTGKSESGDERTDEGV